MIGGFHTDVLLAGAYAVFLVGVALILEHLALKSHRFSQRLRTAGFEYHSGFDIWQCPAGQQLDRRETDRERGIAVYRAPAHACNACRLKPHCTDSDDGRRIEHQLDSWLTSELRRFHRGISLTLLFLASLMLAAEMGRQDTPRDWALILSLLLPMALLGVTLISVFRERR